MNFSKIIFLLTFFIFLNNTVWSVTQTANFNVSVTVGAVCQVAANDLNFGSYTPFNGAPLTAETTIQVTCTIGTNYTLGCNAGNGLGASIATRKLTNGGNTIDYSLYQDNGYANLWGIAGLQLVNGVGDGTQHNVTVYGSIPPGQEVPPATYTDIIQVTVTY